jgi:hypothetical protein
MVNGIKTYEMSFFSCFKPSIAPLIIFILYCVLFALIMLTGDGIEFQKGLLWISIFWLCLNGMPPLILHLNYYTTDKNKKLVINKLNGTMTIIVCSKTQEISFNEIEDIEINRLGLFFSKLPIGDYYYYRICLKNKKSIYVSRMIVEKLEVELKDIKFVIEYCFYPYISKIKS